MVVPVDDDDDEMLEDAITEEVNPPPPLAIEQLEPNPRQGPYF